MTWVLKVPDVKINRRNPYGQVVKTRELRAEDELQVGPWRCTYRPRGASTPAAKAERGFKVSAWLSAALAVALLCGTIIASMSPVATESPKRSTT